MKFKRTPLSCLGSLWIGGRVPVVATPGKPTPAEAVLWLDATRDKILAARVVPSAEAEAVFVALMLQAVGARRGALPDHVRVANERDAACVRGVLPDAVIEVGLTPELARIAPVLSGAGGCQVEHDGTYLHGCALAPAEMARYFDHMAALWQAAPWRFFGDSQGLELDVPAMGIRGACVGLLGTSGTDMFGAVVFDSFGDFDKFRTTAVWQSTAAGRVYQPPGVASLGLVFRRGAELPDDMRLEVAQHGWVVANVDAYPLLLPMDPDSHPLSATERDLQLGCLVSAALAAMVRAHSQRLHAGDVDDFLTCVSLECPERAEAMLWCPHERARPDILGRRPRSRVGAGREQAEADRWLQAFHDSPNVRRRGEAWRGTAVYMIDRFHDFRLDILGMPLKGLKVWHVFEFLLDYVPRDVLADADMVRDTLEVVDAYLEWLGDAGHESALTMARMRTLVGRWRRRFMRKALDPAAFSPGKTFLLSAQAAGVDLEDFAAVAAHHQRFERASEGALEAIEPRGGPRASRVEPASARARPTRLRRRFVFERDPLP